MSTSSWEVRQGNSASGNASIACAISLGPQCGNGGGHIGDRLRLRDSLGSAQDRDGQPGIALDGRDELAGSRDGFRRGGDNRSYACAKAGTSSNSAIAPGRSCRPLRAPPARPRATSASVAPRAVVLRHPFRSVRRRARPLCADRTARRAPGRHARAPPRRPGRAGGGGRPPSPRTCHTSRSRD